MPPSTTTICPVMNEEAIAAIRTASSAISAGSPDVLDRLTATKLLVEPAFIFPVVLAEDRLDQPRRDRVYPDAFRPELDGIRFRHHDQRRLGHAVEQPVTSGACSPETDAMLMMTPARARTFPARSPDQPEGALEVDLDHFVELAFIHLETRTLRDVCGGIVYQDVDRAETLFRSV